jgi:hypothetical protein
MTWMILWVEDKMQKKMIIQNLKAISKEVKMME